MKASSVTHRVLTSLDIRYWASWRTPWRLRLYVFVVPLVALGLACYAGSQTVWRTSDLARFLLLLGCGMVSVAATPRTAYIPGGMTRDFLTVWVLPVAILLPPVYAMLTPIPLQVLTQLRVHRGVVYRRVFTVAAIAIAYGAASVVFHAFPPSFAGPSIGTGTHALTWTVAVALCEIIGGRGHQLLVVGGIKLTDPTVRFARPGAEPRGLAGRLRRVRPGRADHRGGRRQRGPGGVRRPDRAAGPAFHDARPAPRPGAGRHEDRTAERVHLGAGGRDRDRPGHPDQGARWRSRWSTSITSSWSTTPTATWRETRHCGPSPTRCAISCAPTTWPGGSAGKSSRSCCRRRARWTRST